MRSSWRGRKGVYKKSVDEQKVHHLGLWQRGFEEDTTFSVVKGGKLKLKKTQGDKG